MSPAKFANVQGPVLPFGVAASDEALVWLLDRGSDWPEGAMVAEPAPVAGAKVSLVGLEDGPWLIQWWNTLSGKQIAQSRQTVSGGVLNLEAPGFQVDVAARMKKGHE